MSMCVFVCSGWTRPQWMEAYIPNKALKPFSCIACNRFTQVNTLYHRTNTSFHKSTNRKKNPMYAFDVYFFSSSDFFFLLFAVQPKCLSLLQYTEREKNYGENIYKSEWRKTPSMLPLTGFGCAREEKQSVAEFKCAWYTRNNFSVSYFPFCIVYFFLHRVLLFFCVLSCSLFGMCVYVFKNVYQTPRFCFAPPSFRQL